MANIIRTTYPDRASWENARKSKIGASDFGAALGVSKFKSRTQLWKEKTGIEIPKDLHANERVSFGNAAEDPMREMFRLMHPEYKLSFEPFTILHQDGEYSFLSYTPDGELEEIATGRKGLYEGKTALISSSKDWLDWKERIPQTYYSQVIAGLFVGEFDFAVVFALLLNLDGDASLRAYHIERSDCEEDIQYALPIVKKFWGHVQKRTIPPLQLLF